MHNKSCIDAFKNLSIRNDAGILQLSTCCQAQHNPENIINFFNNDFLNSIRQSWNNGISPSACFMCKDAEDVNFQSRRQGTNEWYKDRGLYNNEVELIRLDIWVGDLCNLACCICGPMDSSRWKQELNYPNKNKKVTVNDNWKLLDLSKIQFVHFNGGEPLLNKEHIRLLEAIPNKAEVHINYNTNGTILPSDNLLNLWSKFKLVQLDFSIDDIDDRFEYQRYPAKWTDIKNNLKWFYDNCDVNTMFAVNTTVSILNHNNLNNLNAWLMENFISNRMGDPVEYRKQYAVGPMALNGFADRKTKIIEFLNGCDKRRGSDWRATFPELTKLL